MAVVVGKRQEEHTSITRLRGAECRSFVFLQKVQGLAIDFLGLPELHWRVTLQRVNMECQGEIVQDGAHDEGVIAYNVGKFEENGHVKDGELAIGRNSRLLQVREFERNGVYFKVGQILVWRGSSLKALSLCIQSRQGCAETLDGFHVPFIVKVHQALLVDVDKISRVHLLAQFFLAEESFVCSRNRTAIHSHVSTTLPFSSKTRRWRESQVKRDTANLSIRCGLYGHLVVHHYHTFTAKTLLLCIQRFSTLCEHRNNFMWEKMLPNSSHGQD